MRALLEEFISIMNEVHEPPLFIAAYKTYVFSYSGGDCSKHGRYYGTCASCSREQERHYEGHHERFENERRHKLTMLKWRVENLLRQVDDHAKKGPHKKFCVVQHVDGSGYVVRCSVEGWLPAPYHDAVVEFSSDLEDAAEGMASGLNTGEMAAN